MEVKILYDIKRTIKKTIMRYRNEKRFNYQKI